MHLHLSSDEHKNVPCLQSSMDLADLAIGLSQVIVGSPLVEVYGDRILTGVDLPRGYTGSKECQDRRSGYDANTVYTN